jgi:hypothetical protein
VTTTDSLGATLPDASLLANLVPAAYLLSDMGSARSQQLEVGISSLPGCRRQAGYQHHQVPHDQGWQLLPKPEAWLGTWIHKGVLPSLRTLLHPARIEMPTTWRPGDLPAVPGKVDLYRQRSALVLDVKTVRNVSRVRRLGPWPLQMLQPAVYGAALRQARKPVEWLALLYISREDGDWHLHIEPYDEALVDQARERWAQVVGADDPQQLPQDNRGPGLSRICDECPWLRRCWGPNAKPGVADVQGLDPVDMDAVVAALDLYEKATSVKQAADRTSREADKDRKWARALLEGVPPGTYVGVHGSLTLTWAPGQNRMDQQAVKEVLASLNVGVPYKRGEASPKVVRA